ncbi:hypothetical protein J3A84_04175 [Proteiniclasticum sp. SCR006]|uniref:HTH cro/C1-type domain-containing protein n=1 Tax=Proteiniclasticum aestuarii TaxID=2817862 RepID=A0A939KIQ8_9CLOT|nr:helix-turn-helix transcriptional regulator [Proteiniclasticum aestuarii]MBO1264241.1 hypothetical protein [Proteiniclasticum aestuarii]
MEILSTGEKIRRARIQKGMTLKALCGSEISVSKMSTIENDKVTAEEWVLDLVAKRLGIEKESLKKDIIQEVNDELKKLSENMFSKNYAKEIKGLIEVTEQNGLVMQTFQARIQLINHYIEKGKIEELNVEISHLYRTYINIVNAETQYLYCMTMAKYLHATAEYENAMVFLNFLMSNYYTLPDSITKEDRLLIPYMTVACLVYMEKYEEAKKYLPFVDELLEITENDRIKGQIHLQYCLISTAEDGKENYDKISEYLKNYPEMHAKAKYFLAVKLLNSGDVEGSYREMAEAAKIFPQESLSDNVTLLLDAMTRFVEEGHYKEASKYVDMVVNAAIENQHPDAVEKAYYFKGRLLAENGNYDMAETYLSVSLDMLIKKGKTRELAKRYKDLAKVYYKMGKKEDSIRYFTMSIQTEGHI